VQPAAERVKAETKLAQLQERAPRKQRHTAREISMLAPRRAAARGRVWV
jgi:hypothetical protein